MSNDLSIDWMYFNGIQDGRVNALFFTEETLPDLKKGDLFTIHCGKYSLKVYFKESRIISFRMVTEKMVKESGFGTRELLAYNLQKKYDISAFNLFTPNVPASLENKLFYYISFEDDPSKIFINDGETDYKLNSTSSAFGNVDYYQYNPDYSNHIWEDEI